MTRCLGSTALLRVVMAVDQGIRHQEPHLGEEETDAIESVTFSELKGHCGKASRQ